MTEETARYPIDLIETSDKRRAKGIYESFYFRGNHEDGDRAFWLKHNFILFKKSNQVRIDLTLIVFQQSTMLAKSYHTSSLIPLGDFEKQFHTSAMNRWHNISLDLQAKGHAQLSDQKLEGQINTTEGPVSWLFDLKPSGLTYHHFSEDKFYRGAFPKKKILTKDIRLSFSGRLTGPFGDWQGTFIGMNGHNWGTEHAYRYAYANCNQFKEDATAFFDGFSAKIRLPLGLKSPYLSAGSLFYNGRWYHFNEVMGSWQHHVDAVNEKHWKLALESDEHILSIECDGRDLHEVNVPWVSLMYDHPSGKVSRVNNTKFARLKLELIDRETSMVVTTLTSGLAELESLLP